MNVLTGTDALVQFRILERVHSSFVAGENLSRSIVSAGVYKAKDICHVEWNSTIGFSMDPTSSMIGEPRPAACAGSPLSHVPTYRRTPMSGLLDHDVRPRSAPMAGVLDRLAKIDRIISRVSLPLMRVSLGLLFVWFGALKISNSTPVAELVANTVPFLPSWWFVPALGIFEVLVGIGLLANRWLVGVVVIMVGHLSGTFLVLVTQPEVAFNHGNPLELTMTGEFVMKNLVLISAGLLLLANRRVRSAVKAEM